mmetsp:Transcript_32337/g.51610  ORF Transcript_32337/g.51610 Transcript_32337/m.51610 type:complete len:99 (+) Transcript_32337:26-322(+)
MKTFVILAFLTASVLFAESCKETEDCKFIECSSGYKPLCINNTCECTIIPARVTDTRVAGKRANQLQVQCTTTSDCEGLCLYFEIPMCHIYICVCIRI